MSLTSLRRLTGRVAHLGRQVPDRTRARVEARGAILMYHRVADLVVDPWGLAVTPAHFAEHLDALRGAGWHPVALPHLLDLVEAGQDTTHHVAITFDDGYADNLTTALPLLEAHDTPATVYVASSAVDAAHEFWSDELAGMVLASPDLPPSLDIELGGMRFAYDLGDDAAMSPSDLVERTRGWRARTGPAPSRRHDLYERLWESLNPLPPDAIAAAMAALRRWAGSDGAPRDDHRLLTSGQLAELASHPLVTIGAHSVSHASLPALDPAARHRELVESKSSLEASIGRPVQHLAYPFGHHDDATVEAAQVAGYASAVTTVGRRLGDRPDRFRLPRLTVNDTTGDQFGRRLRWAP